jgi:WD40 repeat protein
MFFRRLSLVGFSALFMLAEGLSFSQEKINQNCIIAKSDEEISSVAWSQDGKFFASAWNNNVVLWDSESGKIKEIYREHTKAVKKVHFSKGGNRLLSLGQDNIVVMRDITGSSGTIRAVGTDLQPMNDAVFAGDNTSVILPGDGGSATL